MKQLHQCFSSVTFPMDLWICPTEFWKVEMEFTSATGPQFCS